MERDEHLRQELDEFKKEKERIRNIVGEIGGKNNKQHKIVSLIFVLLIGVLLILGVDTSLLLLEDLGSVV